MKKEKKQKVKKERKKSTFWVDFKAFISRGNIVDLAVAVVVGAAFTAIVNSLVNDIIKPCIALLVNGNLSELAVVLRPAELAEDGVTVITQAITLNYGNLIMAVFTFLIDAFVIFTAIRIIRNARKKLKEGAEILKDKLNGDDDEAVEETVEETVVVEETPAPVSEPAPASEPTPAVDLETVALLKEIRDLLKADKKEETKVDDNK